MLLNTRTNTLVPLVVLLANVKARINETWQEGKNKKIPDAAV